MAVPRFNHELPALRRQGSFSWSLIIHVILITLMLTVAHWLPQGHIEQRQLVAVTLYAPEPQTAPVPKVIPPPPQVLARLSPPKITPTEPPKIEAPKIEEAPKPFDIAKPTPALPKLEPKKEIVTGAFATNTPAAPVRPKEKDVVTDSFASGSSAQATLQKAPRDVQTGGFGDPNGVKGNSERKGLVQVASLGSFGAPAGPGEGNGTGGSRGARGTVASTGFGDGTAGAGQGDHHNRGGGGTLAQAGFGGAPAAASGPRARVDDKPAVTPVEITYKPQPVYTEEARQLRLEGEVLVQVMFAGSGDLRIQQVVRGLGHGLDEAALQAARQIRFRPARRNGEPYDSVALVHIVFELAR